MTVTVVSVSTREITNEDLGLLLEHRNDPSTRRWLGRSKLLCKDNHAEWYVNMKDDPVQDYRIVVSQDGVALGITRIQFHDEGWAMVGCDLFKEHQRQGYGGLAFRAAMDIAESKGVHKLDLWVFMNHTAARKIYLANGFEFDGDAPIQSFYREDKVCYYARMIRDNSAL